MFGDKQYEEGDIIEDVPTKSVKWLKKQGLIEEVKGLEQAEALQKKRARNSKEVITKFNKSWYLFYQNIQNFLNKNKFIALNPDDKISYDKLVFNLHCLKNN